MTPIQEELSQLEKLDFTGKGEAFVESNFLTPLLKCLGYEAHEDYEVRRHGDDGTSFKLHYPPVERGAERVKHYNPDYIPTIRKKMFWIIDAKSPKDVAQPFDYKYVVQGLQYCIHPEIQAKYLLVCNGIASSLYDAHGAVFLDKDIYEPILEFKASELRKRWAEIYELLSVEKLRTRIEEDLKAMYDKLCLSSLDKDYPAELLKRVGASSRQSSQAIAKTVNRLCAEGMNQRRADWRKKMEKLDAAQTFALMDFPMPPGPTHSHYFVNKSLAEGRSPSQILTQLIHDFDRQCIFRKEQTFVAVCALHQRIDDAATKASAETFFDQYKDADLPLINQVECALLRLVRKMTVLAAYPHIRARIANELQSAPELVRFVQPPTALDMTYEAEVALNRRTFEKIKMLSQEDLQKGLDSLLKMEAAIEKDFVEARSKLADSERQILGFECYGVGGGHYAFKNILRNFGIKR